MKHTIKIFGLIGLLGLITITSCEDDDPSALKIVSFTSTGTDLATGSSATVDLNGTTSATDVPTDGIIAIVFNKEVDPATATDANFTLSNAAGNVDITVESDASGVVIVADDLLEQGTLYTVTILPTVRAADGGGFEATSRTFTTSGRAPAVVPQTDKQVVYLSFNGQVVDALGHAILNNEVTLGTDRFGNVESAATFNGTTNYVGVEYGTNMSNANTTVSYWIKLPASTDYATHIAITQYVTFAIGGNNGTYHEFGRFDNSGVTTDYLKYVSNHVNSGNASPFAADFAEMKNEGTPAGTQVIEVDNIGWLEGATTQWVHIVTSWNDAARRKSFYVNGVPSTVYELTASSDYALDAAVIDVAGIELDATNSKNLYLGAGLPYWATKTTTGLIPFRAAVAHAFKGQMDDFRMYNVALTNAEVLALYNAEKP